MSKQKKYSAIIGKGFLLWGTVCALLVTSDVGAENISPEDQFQAAVSAYDSADYSTAAEAFDQLYEAGYTGLNLCYNAGTAYLQAGNLGRAMLYFERAKKWAPSDRELVLNSEFAEMLTIDDIEVLPRPLIVTWYESVAEQKSWSGWMGWAAALAWITGILFLVRRLGIGSLRLQGAVNTLVIVGLSLSVLTGAIGIQQRISTQSESVAVIMEASVYVKNEPNPSSTDLFILHEGTVVDAGRRIGDWVKVELADGKVGWIPYTALEHV